MNNDDFDDFESNENNDDVQSFEDLQENNSEPDSDPEAQEFNSQDFTDSENQEYLDEYTSYADFQDDNVKDGNTVDEPETDKNQKDSFEQAIKKNKQSGPLKLNKTMIVTTVLLLISFVILFTVFINPLFEKESESDGVDTARKVYFPDFDTIIREPVKETIPAAYDSRSDDEILAELPFSDESQQQQQQVGIAPTRTVEQSAGSPGSARTVSSRPVTNDNPIQKTVSSIPWNTSGYQQVINPFSENAGTQNPYAQFGLPPKEVYQQAVQQFAAAQNQNRYSSYDEANNQSNKQEFANANASNAGRGQWNSEFTLFKGTIIPAVLETGINTDLPGVVIARVTRNIYSSLDGKYLLIPSGTRLYASYNSSVTYAQNRVQIAWNTLIRPDGFEFDLGNMIGTDKQGFAGYKGRTDEHLFEYLKAMGIVSLFTIATGEISNSINTLQSNNTATSYADNLIAENRNIVNRLGERIIDRTLDIQPTLIVNQGTVVEIITNTTVSLPPLNPPSVIQKYIRY